MRKSITVLAYSVAAFLAPGAIVAQRIICPSGVTVPYFGWSTECSNCIVYGSYLEYLGEPQLKNITPKGPADGKVHEHDTLVSVNGAPITSATAWHMLRDVLPGDSIHLGLRRDGREVSATIVPGGRCGSPPPQQRVEIMSLRPRGGDVRSYSIEGTVIEVEGRPDGVHYDERGKLLEINVGGVVVRVRPRG